MRNIIVCMALLLVSFVVRGQSSNNVYSVITLTPFKVVNGEAIKGETESVMGSRTVTITNEMIKVVDKKANNVITFFIENTYSESPTKRYYYCSFLGQHNAARITKTDDEIGISTLLFECEGQEVKYIYTILPVD